MMQEFRFSLIKQGFVIIEQESQERDGAVKLVMFRVDSDNLRFEVGANIEPAAFFNEQTYGSILKTFAHGVNERIQNRRGQNPNTCNHVEVLIGNVKACENCMGKFGAKY
jgi:hypothetical protein